MERHRRRPHRECAQPCGGETWSRVCLNCGEVITRCKTHGGKRSATRYWVVHQAKCGAPTETHAPGTWCVQALVLKQHDVVAPAPAPIAFDVGADE